MGKLTIYQEEAAASTTVSNQFIDRYMADANDAQLKVYLYLLRTIQSGRTTDISDMADLFNHTEKDILRALKYWEKKQLVALDYDASKNLCAVRLLTPDGRLTADTAPQSADIVPLPSAKPLPLPEKPSYSLDDLKAFRSNEETEQLLFIVEQYIGKPLTPPEMKTVLFIYDKLHFSSDLVDYLVQYCVEKDKRDFRYIEKVALSWAESRITTPMQAMSLAKKYDKTVYTVMKALGKTGTPTPKEVSYITRWTKEFAFTLPVIETACERTVMATDKHRFEYADSILASWHRAHVHSIEDIHAADAAYQKSRPAPARSSVLNNQFNQFPQREYDYDALEEKLLSN